MHLIPISVLTVSTFRIQRADIWISVFVICSSGSKRTFLWLCRLWIIQVWRQNGISRETFIGFRITLLPQLLGIHNMRHINEYETFQRGGASANHDQVINCYYLAQDLLTHFSTFFQRDLRDDQYQERGRRFNITAFKPH